MKKILNAVLWLLFLLACLGAIVLSCVSMVKIILQSKKQIIEPVKSQKDTTQKRTSKFWGISRQINKEAEKWKKKSIIL